MRSAPAVTALGVLLVLLLGPGCGEEGAETAGARATAKQRAGAENGAARRDGTQTAGRRRRASAGARRCRRRLGELLDATESLANSLAVGLSYQDYLAAVNRVRAAYASVPARSLSLPCLGLVASPAERALNLYITAVNAWGDCLAS